jgi:pilus assembly protein CpaC
MIKRGGSGKSLKVKRFTVAVFLGLFFVVAIARAAEVAPVLSVTVNQSEVVTLAQRAKRVSVTQPEIAEVTVVAPNQLLINGKTVGTTSLVVWDEKGAVTKYDLIVGADTASLRRQLRILFPEEKIEVSTSGPAILLKGEVSNEVVYDKVLEIAATYLPPRPKEDIAPPAATQSVTIRTGEARLPTTGTAFAGGGQLAFPEESSLTEANRWGNRRAIPGLIDHLVIKEVRLVELNVIVAEISLNKLREIGFDFLYTGQRTSLSSFQGSQGGFATRLFQDLEDGKLTFGDATSGILSHVQSRWAITTLYRLFQNRDITEILAEPKLLIKNGRSGGFLAGGEFPLAVRQFGGGGESTTTVEFKPFGVRLDFIPTITFSNAIDLRVFPEVSEIDQSVAVLGIPGLKVRRTVSRVEMNEGETLVISGLMDRRVLKDLTKVPLLGDIPILGTLFRTTRFRNQETELIFVITPRIVKPLKPGEKPKLPSIEKYDDGDMRQVPLPGDSSQKAPQGPSIP